MEGETEEDWQTYTKDLLTFSESESYITFSYIDKDNEEIEKV